MAHHVIIYSVSYVLWHNEGVLKNEDSVSSVAGSKSKYVALAETLRKEIREGKWKQGDKFPTNRELARRYRLSQSTVMSAMRILTHDGVVVRRRRIGTIVVNPSAKRRSSLARNVRIFVLLRMPGDVPPDPARWFLNAAILRGAMNNNRHHLVRAPAQDMLREEVRSSPDPVAFICPKRPTADERAIIGDAPHIVMEMDSRDAALTNTVNFDKLTSAYRAVEHLVRDLGHHGVAMIWGGLANHAEYLEAYRLALCRNGLVFDESLVVNSQGGFEEAGHKAMEELLDRGVEFSAVFADTDHKAVGAVNALKERGLRVPEDVSIMGADNVEMYSDHHGLTTLEVPYYDMAGRAMALLDQRLLSGGKDVPSVTMYGEVIERDSTRAFGQSPVAAKGEAIETNP